MASRNSRQGTEHRFTQENLSAYIDHQLTPRERKRVAQHLEACGACRRDLAELRQTIALISRAPKLHAPRSFALPPSMQRTRARQRRLEGLFGFARTATVIASMLMVILFMGDMALTFEWIPLAPARTVQHDAGVRVVETHVVEYEAEPEAIAVLESEAISEEPENLVAEAETELEQAVAVTVAEATEEPASAQEDSEAVAMRALPTPDPRTPTMPEGLGGGVVASAASTGEIEAEGELPSDPPPTTSEPAVAPAKETPTAATATHTAIAPTPQPTSLPPTMDPADISTATPDDVAMAIATEEPMQQPSVDQSRVERSAYWQLWGWLRTLWMLTGGLLLVLLGILIWSAYHKHI